jgi:hypothetical protein
MSKTKPTSQSQTDHSERSDRINKLFSRSLEATLHAYEVGKFLEDYDNIEIDRIIVGSPLTLAHALLHQGDSISIKNAEGIIKEVLNMQEHHLQHPHRGNWPRFVGDEEISDLNSAPFILRWLIPLLVEHEHQLDNDILALCRRSLNMALEELERMDVSLIYTNIHLMTLFAFIVGGEWLEDRHFQQIGKERWFRWVRFTVESGAPREYNSLTYMGMNLTVLANIQQMVKDSSIKLQARLLYERFWLHATVHIHRPTRQLAGPHARCYWTPMLTGRERLTEILWRETGWSWLLQSSPYENDSEEKIPVNLELALTDYWLPTFVSSWLDYQHKVLPYEVRETASNKEGYDLSTYLTSAFALGTASCTYNTGTGILAIEQMANNLLLHYARPEQSGGWGLMYSRYVVNDQHLGTLGSFSFRRETNFFDQGNFAGVQIENKAIGLYALLPLYDTYVHSLKTVIAFQSGDTLERVWVDDKSIYLDEKPYPLELDNWLIVEDGVVYIGIRPLEPSSLSRDAPIQLERGPMGELWLVIYNYRGVPKRLWDYASLGGAYWRGNLKAGFVLEVAHRNEYASAVEFYNHLKHIIVEDTTNEFIRTVVYKSGCDELVLSYDLWNTDLKERRLNGIVYNPPNLASPLGVQGDSGELRVGNARLVTKPQQVWLIAQELDPVQQTWIAVNPEDHNTPFRLETPRGVITGEEWGMGRLEWCVPVKGNETLIVHTLRQPIGLQVPEGISVSYNIINQ